MISQSKFEETKASGKLPSPKGVPMRVIELTRKVDVTNQEVARAIKADPALSSRVIKVANAKVAYQTRPIASIVDAVTVLGFNTLRQLVLGLAVMDGSRDGACEKFDYQDFWAHSLLTAITAQNLVLNSGIGSTEEVFILGLLAQIGSLALATVHPQEYARILGAVAANPDTGLVKFERVEFDFDHNQLTQAMLADWGMPRVFQEVVLYHEDPSLSNFAEGSRDWRLLNVLHVADYFSRVCLAQEPHRRKMIPKLILIASRLGVEMDALAKLGDKSVREWHEWSKLSGIRSVELPPFAELLEAVPLVPGMVDIEEELPNGAGTFYKLRILLVDDDKAILLLLQKLLEKAGHTVVTASNGVQGLGMIKEFMPQLIITDWMMPEMDGIEFCKALRQNPAWRNIYVFIMTVQEGMDRLVEAFEAGANDYMTKPVSAKVLVARLRAAQRVVQLQEEMEFDRQQLHKFADELAAFNHRLRKSDVSMRAILENSPYMAWLKDTKGRYIKVNKAYVNYVRLTDAQQVIGKTDFDLWPKALAEKYCADDADVIALRQQKHIEEPSFDGDKIHWVETFKTPVIDENGKVLGSTGFARDITERKLAEERILHLNEELETKVQERTQQLLEAQEELVRKEKLAVLGQVAGSVGHELRNPLGVMSNAVYFLQTVLTDADDSTKEYLNIIQDEIAGSERIVSDLLDSVRTQPSHPEIVDAQELLEKTLHKCAVPSTITVKLDIPVQLAHLQVDPQQIHQVLRNLISNGVEAMPQGGTLEVSALENAQAKTITISVRDTGSGMTPEQLGHLFQPLFTTKARGIGLGLVVVKNLTEANGGSVEVESEAGKGSVFSVTLPCGSRS